MSYSVGYGIGRDVQKVYRSADCASDHCGKVSFGEEGEVGAEFVLQCEVVFTVFSTNYKPYGLAYGSTGAETYKFTDQLQDSASSLYYLHARYYIANIGRFTSPDPLYGQLRNPQSLNRYTYALNNPLGLIDPSGKDWWPGSWTPQQQSQALAIIIVIASIAAIVLTFGLATSIAAPIAAAAILGAIGAGGGAAFYAATAGQNATPIGVLESAGIGLLVGATLGFVGAGGLSSSEPEPQIASEGGLPGNVEKSFLSGSYTPTVAEEDITAFQYGPGGEYPTRFSTPAEYSSSAEAQAKLALNPQQNPATFVREVTIPKGSTYFVGPAAPSYDQPGGGTQIFVFDPATYILGPWKPVPA